jgi:hypothetical protein
VLKRWKPEDVLESFRELAIRNRARGPEGEGAVMEMYEAVDSPGTGGASALCFHVADTGDHAASVIRFHHCPRTSDG